MERSIFTYCFSTCDKGNAGWGFYACTDALLPHIKAQDNIASLLNGTNYSIPELKRQWFTPDCDLAKEEASIRAHHPEKFAYRVADNDGKPLAVLTYGKNLGRETQGQLRPGNALVYTLAGNPDELTTYPACYYGDPEFAAMRRDSFIEGKNTVPTPRLTPVKPTLHGIITEENIMAFLMADESRPEQLVSLFYSMIGERSGLHRAVILCDTKENIIYWIAALTMLLPEEIARKIFFTTYDYLGTESRMEIPTGYHLCGVYSPTANGLEECRATAYDVDALANSTAAVLFDAECIIVPNVKTDAFAEVIRAFAAGNPEPLRQYRNGIISYTSYRDFGTDYTKFYPMETLKPELFSYYSNALKRKMLEQTYPAIRNPRASAAALMQACEITCIAIDDKFLDIDIVRKDVTKLTEWLMLRSDADTDFFEHLLPLFQRIGIESPETLIKNLLTQRMPYILESYRDGNTTTERLIRLTKLLSPFNTADRALLRQMFNAISDHSVSGCRLRDEAVHQMLDEYYGTAEPSVKCTGVLHLFELVDVTSQTAVTKFFEHAMELYPRWTPSRRIDMLRAVDKAEDPNVRRWFFSLFEDWMHTQKYSAVELLRFQNTFVKAQISYAGSMHDICREAIERERDLNARFAALKEYIRLNHENSFFDPKWCIGVVGQILSEQNFMTLNQIAETALDIAAPCGFTQHFINRTGKAAEAAGYSKSAWKKAVNNAPDPEFSAKPLDDVRKQLIHTVENYIQTQDPAADSKKEKEKSRAEQPPSSFEELTKKKQGGLFGFMKRKK